MTSYKKGELVLVPFPFSDQTTTKKRPAVVISSDAYIEQTLVLKKLGYLSYQDLTSMNTVLEDILDLKTK